MLQRCAPMDSACKIGLLSQFASAPPEIETITPRSEPGRFGHIHRPIDARRGRTRERDLLPEVVAQVNERATPRATPRRAAWQAYLKTAQAWRAGRSA